MDDTSVVVKLAQDLTFVSYYFCNAIRRLTASEQYKSAEDGAERERKCARNEKKRGTITSILLHLNCHLSLSLSLSLFLSDHLKSLPLI